MNNHIITRLGLIVILLSLFPSGNVFSADEPVVHALLFFSPTCPHCHKVITEDLPPILEKYGDQIVILGINTYNEEGNELFQSAVSYFDIPSEHAGVPLMVVGEEVLIGSNEIPELLPEIIAIGLASGGIGWPAIPGLAQVLNDQIIPESSEDNTVDGAIEENLDADNQENIPSAEINTDEIHEEGVGQQEESTTVTIEINESIVATENMPMIERFMQDRTGNSISTLVLIGMIFSVVFAGVVAFRSNHVLNNLPNWVIAVFLIIGLSVAIYMAYIEITSSEAVCGPVGDCNTVQQSPYAHLFGIIPIGFFGVMGYLSIGSLWILSVWGPQGWRSFSVLSLWGLSFFGMVFSIYLTFLEPFVIGATCAWCLTSSIVMSVLFWNSTAALKQIGGVNQLKFIRQE